RDRDSLLHGRGPQPPPRRGERLMYPFAILRPAGVEEAVAMLRADPEAQLLAGGQSLLPMFKHRLTRASALIDLGRLAGLRHIVSRDGAIVIGAMARHAEVAASEVVRSA